MDPNMSKTVPIGLRSASTTLSPIRGRFSDLRMMFLVELI